MFMRPEIEFADWVEVEFRGESHWVQSDLFEVNDFVDRLREDDELVVRKRRGYGARLSAPGYLDCTEWVVFGKEDEAALYLADTYFDEPLEEMEPDALGYLHDLLEKAGDEDTVNQIRQIWENEKEKKVDPPPPTMPPIAPHLRD